MIVSLISWVIFGALAGWVASLIAGNSQRQGCIGNIIVGVLGAFLGGLAVELFSQRPFEFDWSWRSFAVAVIGAVVLLAITGQVRRRGGGGRRRR